MICKIRSQTTSPLIGAMLLPLVTAGVATADVISAHYVNDNNFSYHIINMPDLDQKRSGLLGDGSFHCVPTSTLNLIFYAANHGFDDVQPGPGNWQSPANYATATGYIGTMGNFMQTSFTPGDPLADPPVPDSGGTSGSNALAGLNWYLGFQPNYFVVNHHLTSPGYTTNVANVAKSLISGNIGTIAWGRYDVVGTVYPDIPMVVRDGGHAVTVSRATRNGPFAELWVRDPSSSDSLHAQSPFEHRVLSATDVLVYLMSSMDPPTPVGFRVMTALNYNPFQTRLALMDGHLSIRPKAGYSFSESKPVIDLNMPAVFNHGAAPSQQQIPLPSGIVRDVTFSPFLGDFLAIVEEDRDNRLVRLNPLTSEQQTFELRTSPELLVAASNGSHYVVTDDAVITRFDGQMNEQIQAVLPVADLSVGEQLTLNYTKIEVDYLEDDSRPSSIVIAPVADRKAVMYSLDLASATIRDIPTLILGNTRDMAIEPSTGRVWFATDAGSTLYGVLWDVNGHADVQFLNHPSVVDPMSIEFDDAGELYVCTEGQVVVLRREANGWEKSDSLFQGMTCAGKFRMMRNSSNYDPEFHDTPGWTRQIDPDELDDLGPSVQDCTADLNHDGMVDVSDLLLLLESWGTCAVCSADLTFDAQVDLSDLLSLLSAWGQCQQP